jgi:hypothetical protein
MPGYLKYTVATSIPVEKCKIPINRTKDFRWLQEKKSESLSAIATGAVRAGNVSER